jgi:hypothetical protein
LATYESKHVAQLARNASTLPVIARSMVIEMATCPIDAPADAITTSKTERNETEEKGKIRMAFPSG